MKMLEIPGRTFKKLSAVLRCVPRTSRTLPILETVCFQTMPDGELVIDGTDLEAYASLLTGIDGPESSFCVPRAAVRAVLEATHVKDVVQISQDEKYVMFEVGDYRIACRPWDAVDFPTHVPFHRNGPDCAKITFAPSLFLPFLAKDLSRYVLTGMYVWEQNGQTRVAGADGYRFFTQLGIDKTGAELGKEPIMLLPNAFRVARAAGKVEVTLDLKRKWFQFMYDGVIYEGGFDHGLSGFADLVQTHVDKLDECDQHNFVIEEPQQIVRALHVLGKAHDQGILKTSGGYWSSEGFYLADDDKGIAALFTGLKLGTEIFDEPNLNSCYLMDTLIAFGLSSVRMVVKDRKSPICFTSGSGDFLGVLMPMRGERLFLGSGGEEHAKGNLNRFIPGILTNLKKP